MNKTRPHTNRSAARRRTQVIVLAALLVLLAFVGLRPFARAGTPSRVAAAQPTRGPLQATAANPHAAVEAAREPLRVQQPTRPSRDLFDSRALLALLELPIQEAAPVVQPGVDMNAIARAEAREEAELRKRLTLQGTILDGEPRAMINGEVWRCGQQLAGWTLTQISARQVALVRDGRQVVLAISRQ